MIHDRTQALLLVGWLGSRLGWRPADTPSEHEGVMRMLLARPDGDQVAVELRPVEPKDDVLDRLATLRLECPRARFVVGRDESPATAVARSEIEGMAPLQRVVRLECLDEAGLIAEELRLLGRDRPFEGALGG